MEEEGMVDEFLKGFDWDSFNLRTTTQDVVDRLEEPTRKFFKSHPKTKLFEEAIKHRAMLFPVDTTADILASAQLAARGYWVEVEHPELGTTITYPGAFVQASETPPRIWRRAPLIGEHNQEVYEKELGLSREKLLILKQAKVI
jgi:crotonobetainyl-CoA:carnitine CoA-transferase CaiB-like acyl-CoA transferase